LILGRCITTTVHMVTTSATAASTDGRHVDSNMADMKAALSVCAASHCRKHVT